MSTTRSRDRCALGFGQVRIPQVEDQHDTRRTAAIPRLVLVRIVEHHDAPFRHSCSLAADIQCALLGGTISGR